jgi:hypothetical protein
VSASSTLSEAEMSRVASAPRSLGVCSEAMRRALVLPASASTDFPAGLAALPALLDLEDLEAVMWILG